jgi:hypothetical protein
VNGQIGHREREDRPRFPTTFHGVIFSAVHSITQSTAGHAEDLTGPVRVTHPFHPKFGQELDVIVRRCNWGEDRIFYREPAGNLASLPSRWTSVVPEDLFVVVAAGRSRFRVQDLVDLVAMVGRHRR